MLPGRHEVDGQPSASDSPVWRGRLTRERDHEPAFGNGVIIDDHCTLITRSERGLTLGDETRLKAGVYLDTEGKDGYIEVGKRVYIGTNCCLHGHRGLEIGDDTLVAQNITITPYSHRFEDPLQPIIRRRGAGGTAAARAVNDAQHASSPTTESTASRP